MDHNPDQIRSFDKKQLSKYITTINQEALGQLVMYFMNVYYNGDEAEMNEKGIDDWKFDMLWDAYAKEIDSIPIGSALRESDNRVKLPYWLGSLKKYKPEDSRHIERWAEKYNADNYVAEAKLDGISCLYVNKNKTPKIYTRGNGSVGADITYLLDHFKGIPIVKKDIVVRGELIMSKNNFKKYPDKTAARNMVSGLVNAKTSRDGLQHVDFVVYELIEPEMIPSLQLAYLKKLGFKVVEHSLITEVTSKTLSENLIESKKNSAYEIDGITIQPDKKYKRNDSGNPAYAFAFKMVDEEDVVESTVVEVLWNPSKWGVMKPRVRIEPVEVSGATITYTTGFNAKYILDNKIGPGAVVNIIRSGDVIPKITEVLLGAEEASFPDCEYEWNDTGVDIIASTLEEELAEEASIKKLSVFFSELGAKYLGPSTMKKLFDSGFNTIIKILKASVEDFETVDTIKKKSAERIYTNVRLTLSSKIPDLLGAASVFGFGFGKRKVNMLFANVPNVMELDGEDLFEAVYNTEGFSAITAHRVVENMKAARKFLETIKPFLEKKRKKEPTRPFLETEGVSSDSSVNTSSNSSDEEESALTGMKLVMSGFRDADMEKKIVKMGGSVVTSVSKNTDYLIVKAIGEKETGKIKKAKAANVEVISKADFIERFF